MGGYYRFKKPAGPADIDRRRPTGIDCEPFPQTGADRGLAQVLSPRTRAPAFGLEDQPRGGPKRGAKAGNV